MNSWIERSFNRYLAWLVTGPLGRGTAFAIDFIVALRAIVGQR
jgi:hypothetical protein